MAELAQPITELQSLFYTDNNELILDENDRKRWESSNVRQFLTI